MHTIFVDLVFLNIKQKPQNQEIFLTCSLMVVYTQYSISVQSQQDDVSPLQVTFSP